jgi:DNA primase
MDPDEVVGRDPKEWERIVADARPVVIHVMEALAAGRNLDDPKVKNEIAAQVLPLIDDVPSAIERDTYLQRLARLLRVSEGALLEIAPSSPRPRPSGRRPGRRPVEQRPAPAQIPAAMSSYSLEAYCLGILLRRPDLLYQVDRRMQNGRLPRLSPEDFLHADHQAIVRVFQESIEQDMAEPQNFVLNSLSLSMMELADSMLDRTAKLDPQDQRVLEDLMRGLLTLRRRRIDQELEYWRFLLVEAQERGDLKATQDAQTVVKLAKVRRFIDEALKEYTSRSTTGVRQQ